MIKELEGIKEEYKERELKRLIKYANKMKQLNGFYPDFLSNELIKEASK